MMGKLQEKVAVVTGGTTGIGFATAKRFVDEGAYVFITGRRQKELDEAVKAIGGNVASVRGDVSKLPDLDRLYETVKAKGKIDVLVANAGIGSVASAKAQLPSVPTARPRPRFEFCTNMDRGVEGPSHSLERPKSGPDQDAHGRSTTTGSHCEDPSHHTDGTHGRAGRSRQGSGIPGLGRFQLCHGHQTIRRWWPRSSLISGMRGAAEPASRFSRGQVRKSDW
jgi:hypothetical protein